MLALLRHLLLLLLRWRVVPRIRVRVGVLVLRVRVVVGLNRVWIGRGVLATGRSEDMEDMGVRSVGLWPTLC